MFKIYGGWWLILQTPSLNESRSAHPCIEIQQFLAPSIRLSIYSCDLASLHLSSHTGSQERRQGRTQAHTITHAHTFKSTNPSTLCQSVCHPHTHTHAQHTHTWARTHIHIHLCILPGPVAQFAARQICILSSIQGSWYRTQIQPNNFHGDWSWDSFYTHSLSTAESSKAVVINWRKYVFFVLVNCLGGLSMSGYSVYSLTHRVQHYLISVDQTKSIHINDLMAKHRHILDLMAGIILSLLYHFWQLVSKSDRDKIDELLFPRV